MSNYLLAFAWIMLFMLAKAKQPIDDNTDVFVNMPKLKITIIYESLCPYCIEFVTWHLFPSMLKGRFDVTELKMLPYGKANIDSKGHITCQHGITECEKNALHACILEHHDIREALRLIKCLMEDDRTNIDICGNRYAIDVTVAKNCLKKRSIDEILLKYQRESAEVPYHYVPAVEVDDQFDIDEQQPFTDSFDKAFCAKYKAKFNIQLDMCD